MEHKGREEKGREGRRVTKPREVCWVVKGSLESTGRVVLKYVHKFFSEGGASHLSS